MQYILITKTISNFGNITITSKEFNSLIEAKSEAYLELNKVSKKLEVVKVVILNEDLNKVFHEINGSSIFEIKINN